MRAVPAGVRPFAGVDDPLRVATALAAALLALIALLAPWYALDDYVPNGWDATWWARLAALLAVANVAVLRFTDWRRVPVALAAAALVLVAVRVAWPPDFGFDFDGLTVPVERRAGCWAALLVAPAHLALAALLARRGPAAGASAASP